MPVVVPSAPDMQETTRMLEDSESVSAQGHQDIQGQVPGPKSAADTDTLHGLTRSSLRRCVLNVSS